jgi:protein O-GlcNAc transferase
LPDVGRIFDDAMQLHEAGQLAEAAVLYEEALSLQPDLVQARQNLTAVKNALGDVHLTAGQVEDALDLYGQALNLDNRHPGTFNNVGRALLALGRIPDAIEQFENALKLDPVNANFHFNLALALSGLGKFAKSINHFKKVVRDRTDWPGAFFGLATALSRTGKYGEAVPVFRKGLALQPDNSHMETEFASCLIAIDEETEAMEILTRALQTSPRDAQACYLIANLLRQAGQYEQAVNHNRTSLANGGEIIGNSINMANALVNLDRAEEAIDCLQTAIENVPDNAQLWLTLGNALLAQGNASHAIRAYQRSVELDPQSALAANNLAMALLESGDADRALDLAIENSVRFPNDAGTWGGLGTVHLSLERFDEALKAFDKSLALFPEDTTILQNKSKSLHRMGRYDEASHIGRQVVALSPDVARSHFNLANMLQMVGQHGEAITELRHVLEIDRTDIAALSLLAHSLNQECRWAELKEVKSSVISQTRQEFDAGAEISASPFSLLQLSAPGDIRLASARQSASDAEALCKARRIQAPFVWLPTEGNKLRIGYISPDFRNHSAGRAFSEIMQVHDKDRFSFFGYSTAPSHDQVTDELESNFHFFHKLHGVPAAEAAKQINKDGINILVDLAGHTRGSRLEILAERPAPVQAHFMGYGHTIGADYVDWLITDEVRTPASEVVHCHEKIVYLPHMTLAARRQEIQRAQNGGPDRQTEGLPDTAIVLANFNGHYKFDEEIFAAWMEILRATPDAVLWLMKFEGGSVDNLRQAAREADIDPQRLIFADKCDNDRHLARLALADLALDTYYHAGGVTTTDALSAGVPVLTLLEDGMVDRMGASLLQAADLPELVATSVQDYTTRALSWCHDRDALKELREKLHANKSSAPLFDARQLAHDLEQAYAAMWQDHDEDRRIDIIRA